MKKGLLLFTSMLSVAAVCIAQPVSEDQAGSIALQFLSGSGSSMNAQSRGVQTLEVAYTAQNGSDNDFYVFNRQGGGFVIVSADERTAKPVLAYSFEGSFDADNIPPAQEDILSGYRQQIDYARKNMDPVPDVLKNSSPVGTVIVEPLIKTKWNQEEPYNKLCPTVDGYKTSAGCVACAMAQVMNYWRWPERGHGSHRNALDNTLYVDFNESVYDWGNMALTYTADSSQVKIDAVSKLMFDCGMSVDMDYPINGTYSALIPQALMAYFNYSSKALYIKRSLTANWDSVIAAELDAERPVLYSGADEWGGHAFICDGYDSEGYFHFNLGWGGYGDGFYLTDAVYGEGLSGLNSNQEAIIGIYPDYDDKCRDGDAICRLDDEGCAVLYDVVRSTDSIDIIIPESTVIDGVVYPVKKIADYSFSMNDKYCSKLIIPETVEIIGYAAFYSFQRLSNVSIPGSVHTIGNWAFAGCSNLQFVQLGEGVETIGFCAFRSCGNLRYINYPSTLKVIDSFAFQYDSLLSSNLNLPDGFTTLGTLAYGDNQSLTTAQLPGTMVSVPDEVFWGCTSLAKVTLGEGITTIEQSAFYDCPSLHELTLPASIDSIGDSVFIGSTRIDRLVFLGSVPPAVANSDSIFNDYHTLLVVPDGSTEAYRAHPFWGLFQNITEDAETIVRTLQHSLPVDIYYDMQGRRLDSRPQGNGLFIINGKKTIVIDSNQ